MNLLSKIVKSKSLWMGVVLIICMVAAGVNLSLNRVVNSIISPPRKELEEYHKIILDNTEALGIKIESFSVLDDQVPTLVVSPTGGVGKRGEILRAQLRGREIDFEIKEGGGALHGTVMILHGRKGRKEDMLPIAERFCAIGFRCIIPDLPAHGESPIGVCHYGASDFETGLAGNVYDALSEVGGYSDEPVHLLGISMGGSFATHAVAKSDSRWTSLTLVASFGSLQKVIEHKTSSVFESLIAKKIISSGGTSPKDIVPENLEREIELPLLQLHGVEDGLIPLEQGISYFECFKSPDKQFIEVPGARHDNILVTPMEVYAEMTKFMLRQQSVN